LTGVIFVCFHPLASAQEWTRFRGPNGSGISDAKSVPVEWTEKDYNWVADLPGRGHSSPVIWGDKLFVTSCDEESAARHLLCIHTRDGTVAWRKDFEFASYRKHKNNSYASSTPCVDEDFVYVAWHSRKSSPLVAFDHEGNKVWEYELGLYLHGQGGAASPIVYEDSVILANDQKQPSFLLAVDCKSGAERWKIPREGKRACYGTPCVFARDETSEELIFSHCYEGIIGVDPLSGKQNWHIDVFGRASQRALGSPIIADDLVIATSGAAGGERQLVAVRPAGVASEQTTAEAFRATRGAPHVPTPLVYKDWLFMWSDQGIASCLDKVSGKVIWQKRVGGNYFSSPVCIDGRLYCVDLDGDVVVIAASDKYELLAKNCLGEPTKATPAVSGGTLFIRTESHLFSIGGR
jgi:outer membrane protein assembly factor BamB